MVAQSSYAQDLQNIYTLIQFIPVLHSDRMSGIHFMNMHNIYKCDYRIAGSYISEFLVSFPNATGCKAFRVSLSQYYPSLEQDLHIPWWSNLC